MIYYVTAHRPFLGGQITPLLSSFEAESISHIRRTPEYCRLVKTGNAGTACPSIGHWLIRDEHGACVDGVLNWAHKHV